MRPAHEQTLKVGIAMAQRYGGADFFARKVCNFGKTLYFCPAL